VDGGDVAGGFAGQFFNQFGRRRGARLQAGRFGFGGIDDAGGMSVAAHLRQEFVLQEAVYAGVEGVKVFFGHRAIVPLQLAMLGDDVERAAAVDDADINRAVWRFKRRRGRVGGHLGFQVFQIGDKAGGELDGADAVGGG